MPNLAALEAENAKLRSQLSGVCGALADAGNVLANRVDGNYGESVRELVKERDDLRFLVIDDCCNMLADDRSEYSAVYAKIGGDPAKALQLVLERVEKLHDLRTKLRELADRWNLLGNPDASAYWDCARELLAHLDGEKEPTDGSGT